MNAFAPLFNRFVFPPNYRTARAVFTPRQVGCSYEDVQINTADGLALSAWYLPAGRPTWEMLYLHGNAGDRRDWFRAVLPLLDLGCSVLLLDYRGYGGNPGEPGETGLLLDGEAAWRWLELRRQQSGLPAAVLGKSLGSGVATYLAARFRPDALILDSAYTTMDNVIHGVVPWAPRALVPRSFDSLSRAVEISCPSLLLHGERDKLIPLHHAQRLRQSLGGPNALVAIAAAGHNDLSSQELYYHALADFLSDPLGYTNAAGRQP
jgi:hypothetical protein